MRDSPCACGIAINPWCKPYTRDYVDADDDGRRGVSLGAQADPQPCRIAGIRQEPAREGAPRHARLLESRGQSARPDRADHGGPSGTHPPADRGAGCPDGGLALRLPARCRQRLRERLRVPACDRYQRDHLRRLPPGQLRLLPFARGRAGARPQRLRRSPSGLVGMGHAAAGRECLRGRPAEPDERAAVQRRGEGLRQRLSR